MNSGAFCPQALGKFLLAAETHFRDSAQAYSGLLQIATAVAEHNLGSALVLLKAARYSWLGQSWFFPVFERMVYTAMCPHIARSHGQAS